MRSGLVVLLAFCLLRPGAASAETPSLQFDIPAEPLAQALDAYSTASHVQLLYDTKSAAGHRSAPVAGRFTPMQALTLLLAGSGLVAAYTGERNAAVVVVPAETASRGGEAADRMMVLSLPTLHVSPDDTIGDTAAEDYSRYSGVVRADVQRLLDRNSRTLSGTYTVGVALWLDGAGTVRRGEVFRSTGDPARDAAIALVLNRLTISQVPPSHMPQPVKVVIAAHRA